MNNSSAPSLDWLDNLSGPGSNAGTAHLRDMTTLESAREVLPETVISWALDAAEGVADEVDALRQSESIAVHEGTGRLERLACAAGVLTTLVSLRSGEPVDHAPEEMLRQIRSAYHQGEELSSLIRFVWSHHARFQERLLLAQRELAPTEDSSRQLQDLHTRMHQILEVYISAIDAEFRREENRWAGGVPAQRRELLEKILADGDVPADAGERLGLRLDGGYFFAFLGSRESVFDDLRREQIRHLREQVGREIGAVDGFSQDFGDDDILWCLTFPAPPVERAGHPLASVRLPADLQIGVGSLVQGPRKLGTALRGAAEARRFSRHPARAERNRAAADLVFHDDIRVLSIMTRADDELAAFAEHILGDLAADTPKNADLRRTLLTYLMHSRSRKEAARLLHISPNTVAYRVDQARALMQSEDGAPSLEVLVALKLLEFLPGLTAAERMGSGNSIRRK